MTLAQDVGRDRHRGGERSRRSRPQPKDRLPQPRAIAAEARELRVRLSVLVAVYDVEHDALASLASSDVHVQTGPSDTTVSSLLDGENEAARDRCREAVKFLRRAAANVDEALKAFGPEAVQPSDTSPDAIVDHRAFTSALAKRQHIAREEELRR